MATLQRRLYQLRGEILNNVAQTPERAAKRRERQAWIVLLAAFSAFLLLCILIPYGLRRFYVTATVAKEGALEVVTGTVRITHQGASADVAANNGDPILEGFTVKTDNTSRAMITLFEGSTILVFENTELMVKTLRTSRFTKNTTRVVLVEHQGSVRIGVAPATTHDNRYIVETPQSVINLNDGSYAIEVGPQGTALSVRAGSGDVTANRVTATVRRGQRSTVAPGQAPSAQGSAALDLVLNGDFGQLDVGWTKKIDVEAGRRDDLYGQTFFLSAPEGPAVRFVRRGSKNSHGENILYQAINRDVSDFVSLKLSVDFRLIYQSLSGGGYLGSEYPLLVQVTYRDDAGNQYIWARGFYYQNDAGYPTTYGEQMPIDVWIPYEKDLFSLDGYPKPRRLLSVEVVASGWDYESMIKSVSVLAE